MHANEESVPDVGALLLRVVQCTKVVGGVVACNAYRPVSIVTEVDDDDLKRMQFYRSDGMRILCVAEQSPTFIENLAIHRRLRFPDDAVYLPCVPPLRKGGGGGYRKKSS